MLDEFVICDNGLENTFHKNQKAGYRIKIGLPYYRSIPLSCFEEITLQIDDEEVDTADITLSFGKKEYPISELEDKADIWWNFLDKWFLNVKNDKGISNVPHKIAIRFVIRIPYMIPTNDDFVTNYDVTNAIKVLEVNV